MNTSEPLIRVKDVSKKFPLRKPGRFALAAKKPAKKYFWALNHVTFDLEPGTSLAIIGRNGAGKSTLLSVIQQTLQPTHGSVEVKGTIGSLLELGAGFHPELTGRENIHLNCSLNGMNRGQVLEILDEIIDFSELKDFIDQPIKTYSSGMHVRLGFSVAVHIDPDIVIIDEALSVGDRQFQAKCMKRIHSFKEKGKTLIFVTHKLDNIDELCPLALWLEAGSVRGFGPSRALIDQYTSEPTGS